VNRATDDAFFVVLEATDPKFSENGARKLLESAGAAEVSELEN
jgi:hypothetical protein